MEAVPLLPYLPYLSGLIGLLILSGFFSGSETALCALTQVQIERIRTEKGRTSAIVNFVDNPRRLFITVLLGNNLVNVAFAILMVVTTEKLIPLHSEWIRSIVALLLSVLLMLIFGEMTPKTYAIKHAETFAKITAPILWAFSVCITPLRALLRKIIDSLIPIFGGNPTQDEQLTAADLKEILNTYQTEALPPDERHILTNILQLLDIEAKEIMVPRTEVIAVPTSNTIQQTLKQAKESGFSRIPVYRGHIDKICGIFYVKDLLLWRHAQIHSLTIDTFLKERKHLPETPANAPLIRDPIRVLETRKIGILLQQLKHEKTKIAILKDEYGGTSGIVTTEDIIEQVVGDITDEHDKNNTSPTCIQHAENPLTLETSARMTIRDLNQQFKLKLDENNADTIGGYALRLFGRIPTLAETQTDENGIEFTIIAIDSNVITRLLIKVNTTQQNQTEI